MAAADGSTLALVVAACSKINRSVKFCTINQCINLSFLS